ncbi:Aprataxin [Clonorchis sinensis]|uniref:Aprataxin n=1 Tax=Clonorchis sinensis TaxID=79923 RepID=A0A8T1LYH8_CLOSI|nr:Aprataxin [Clonorchis sinensis]
MRPLPHKPDGQKPSKSTVNSIRPNPPPKPPRIAGKAKNSVSSTMAAKRWFGGHLMEAMKDPNVVVKQSDLWVIIRDRYPKATHHFLVLPKKPIRRLTDVGTTDLSLLQSMHSAAESLALEHNKYEFQIGYHAVPSMPQLHLHVISTDFCSLCLKTKKHWNSFTTNFFIPSQDFMKMVEDNQHRELLDTAKYEQLLKQDLKCHKCPVGFKTIPALKAHLEQHNSERQFNGTGPSCSH